MTKKPITYYVGIEADDQGWLNTAKALNNMKLVEDFAEKIIKDANKMDWGISGIDDHRRNRS